MDAVKNDLTVKQETAIAELENYKQEADYDTDNWAKVLAEVVKGKNTINAAETVEAVDKALADAKAEIDKIPDKNAAVWTITFNDGTNACGTINIVQGQTATLADLKAKVTVPDGKKLVAIYTDSAMTQEITEGYTPTADSTLYVKLEVLQQVTKTLTPDGLSGVLNDTAGTGLKDVGTTEFKVTNGGSEIKIAKQNSLSVIQTGGAVKISSGKMQNGIVLNCTAGSVSVKVKYFQGSVGRYAAVLDATGKSLGDSSSIKTTADKEVKEATIEFTLAEAGNIYIGSVGGGLYFTEIAVTYSI